MSKSKAPEPEQCKATVALLDALDTWHQVPGDKARTIELALAELASRAHPIEQRARIEERLPRGAVRAPLDVASRDLVEWVECIIRQGVTGADVAGAIVARLHMNGFGEPKSGATEAVQQVLDAPSDDSEKAVVDVLAAYGLSRAAARNKLKYRDMRVSRSPSSAR